jgi:hypothetical protein
MDLEAVLFQVPALQDRLAPVAVVSIAEESHTGQQLTRPC